MPSTRYTRRRGQNAKSSTPASSSPQHIETTHPRLRHYDYLEKGPLQFLYVTGTYIDDFIAEYPAFEATLEGHIPK